MLQRIHHVQITIPKNAESEARKFYCELLELNEMAKPEALAARGGFWLELGETQIHVGVEDGIDREKSKAHIAYLVADLEAWRAKLQDIDTQIIEGIEIPHYRRFEFRDPFGNRVEFLEQTDNG